MTHIDDLVFFASKVKTAKTASARLRALKQLSFVTDAAIISTKKELQDEAKGNRP